MYYNPKTIGWRNKTRKFIQSLTPILLSIPVLIFPILIGTPTTDNFMKWILILLIFLFHGSLTENIFLTYEVLLLIPLVCFTLFYFFKNAQILIYIFTIYLSYHFIFSASNGVTDAPKYLLEQIGFVYIFSFTF